jgi:hypothetical protein
MARHLYVYYKVDPAQAPALKPAVRAVLERMRSHCGFTALRRRPHTPGDDAPQIWMEVYEDVRPSFEPALAAALTAPLASTLRGCERHFEWFEDLSL